MKTPKKQPTKSKPKQTKPKPAKPKDPTRLNIQQQRFAELVVSGESDVQAYMKATKNPSVANAEKNAWRMRDHEGVKAYIAQLRKPETKAALRKKDDNLRFLAEVIGTALRDIGPDSPLCVEYSEDFIAGGSRGKLKRGDAPSGNEVAGVDVIRRRVKKPDPLRAIELYSRLLGHFEPDRTEIDVGPKTLLSIKERAEQVVSALARRYAD